MMRFSYGRLALGLMLVLSLFVDQGLNAASLPLPVEKATKDEVIPAKTPEWDKLVADAQKEGVVNIYGTALAPVVLPLSQAFKKQYGINLEFVQGRPAEVTAKINSERSAGLFLADIGHLGDTTTLMDIKPRGITVPLDDLLILPTVKNPRNWIGEKLPFADKDHHIITFMGQALPYGVFNKNMVREGEITSFLDLLQPQWKGKILFNDPTISGPGPNLMAALIRIFGKNRALEIFRQLASQEPIIMRDNRMLLEWVAREKYPILLGPSMALFSQFTKAGAPLKVLRLKEARYIGSGPGNILIFNNSPHPKATQLYLNWLLSREGSSIWQNAMKIFSRRVDINKQELDTDTEPDAHDFLPDEEQMKLRVEMRKVSLDIFGKLLSK